MATVVADFQQGAINFGEGALLGTIVGFGATYFIIKEFDKICQSNNALAKAVCGGVNNVSDFINHLNPCDVSSLNTFGGSAGAALSAGYCKFVDPSNSCCPKPNSRIPNCKKGETASPSNVCVPDYTGRGGCGFYPNKEAVLQMILAKPTRSDQIYWAHKFEKVCPQIAPWIHDQVNNVKTYTSHGGGGAQVRPGAGGCPASMPHPVYGRPGWCSDSVIPQDPSAKKCQLNGTGKSACPTIVE